MDQNKTIEIFNTNAALYEAKFKNVSKYSEGLDLFCHAIKPLFHILDIACGPGNIANYMLAKNNKLNWHGIDLAENMITIAKHKNPKAIFEVKNGNSILELNKKFDGIVCSFYLPYINVLAVKKLIADAKTILNTNGLIYISANKGEINYNEIVTNSLGNELTMYYYSTYFLTMLLEKNNFKILYNKSIEYKDEKENTIAEIIIVASL